MKRIFLGLLIVSLLAVPVLAAPSGDRLGDLSVVTWLEKNEVIVALANESNSSQAVSIRTDTIDSRWRPVFAERTVNVPGRSVIFETFSLSSFWKNEPIRIEVGHWYQYVELEVQTTEILVPSNFVLRSGEELEVDVNLLSLFEGLEGTRLIIDESYQMLNSITKGPIRVRTLEGGFEYFPFRNSVEYVRPRLLLSMMTPQLNNVGILSFKLVKIVDGYRGYREVINGPAVLVFGRNLRFAQESEAPRPPRLITR
ncbi:MAG: hypothetical protein GX335_03300 [Firmicutes bacterium]|nr:hypothetical protein [Bacillota bacterium]